MRLLKAIFISHTTIYAIEWVYRGMKQGLSEKIMGRKKRKEIAQKSTTQPVNNVEIREKEGMVLRQMRGTKRACTPVQRSVLSTACRQLYDG